MNIFLYITLYGFLVLKSATSLHELELSNITENGDNILCRGCGSDIAVSNSINSVRTPFADSSFHDKIFGKEVLVQVLVNDYFIPYPIITTSNSDCVAYSEWEDTGSWFPGFQWKPCFCPDCGNLIGWAFKPIPRDLDRQPAFFAIIITNLISESFLNSLTVIPVSSTE